MGETSFKTLSRQMAGREGMGGSAVLVTIILLVVVMIAWANSAQIDNVTRGEGRYRFLCAEPTGSGGRRRGAAAALCF
jgi:hypothetical protein